MELLLEFIFDLIGEIIIDGSKESWIPKPVRIFFLILFLGVYITLTGLFIFVAIKNDNILLKVLFAGLAIGFIALIIWHIINVVKKL